MRIIVSRELGAEALGVYQISQSFFYVLVTVVASGLPTTISHFSARYKVTENKDAEGSAVSASLIIGITISIILEVLLFCFKNVIINSTTKESWTIILCLSPSILITAIYGSFRGALWGRQKHIQNCISEIGEQGTRLLLFVIMLSTAPSPIAGAIRASMCYTISCLVSMFLTIFFYFKGGSKLKSPKTSFKRVLKSSLPITMLHLISSLLQPIISIIVPYELRCSGYTEAQAIGLFGIITGMTLPLLTLPDTLIGSYSTALMPEISKSLVVKDKKQLQSQIKSAITFTLFICFCFVPVYIGSGENIGSFLFNNATSGYLLARASFVMVPMGLNSITQGILNSLDMESKSFKNYILGSIFMIISIIFLPKYMGVNALIIGLGLSISISAFFNVRMISKYLGLKTLILKPLLLMTFFAIPSSMLGSSVGGILKCLVPQFFNIAFSCLTSLICFVLLCVIFNIINVSTIFASIKRFKNIKIMRKKKETSA
ncbi:MAG TPA: hypothetical protein DCO89_00795 [Clostridiales bacterium]|nr:hypothetical protein [Clostridiales bacterium]